MNKISFFILAIILAVNAQKELEIFYDGQTSIAATISSVQKKESYENDTAGNSETDAKVTVAIIATVAVAVTAAIIIILNSLPERSGTSVMDRYRYIGNT